MSYIKQAMMISAILPKGASRDVIAGLKKEKGITTANFNYARGVGKLTPNKYRGMGDQSEKEVLTVVVKDERANEIFEYIYELAEINKPHGGLIYMYSLGQTTEYVLPEAIEDER